MQPWQAPCRPNRPYLWASAAFQRQPVRAESARLEVVARVPLARSPAQLPLQVTPPVAPPQTMGVLPLAAMAMAMAEDRRLARGQKMLPLPIAAGPELGIEPAGPDPVNRPALVRHSVMGPRADPVTGPEAEDRLALDRAAASGFEPVAGTVDQPTPVPPPLLAFGTLVEHQLAPVQTAAVGPAAESGTVAGLEPGAATAFG